MTSRRLCTDLSTGIGSNPGAKTAFGDVDVDPQVAGTSC
jgi:hypothetical protein